MYMCVFKEEHKRKIYEDYRGWGWKSFGIECDFSLLHLHCLLLSLGITHYLLLCKKLLTDEECLDLC